MVGFFARSGLLTVSFSSRSSRNPIEIYGSIHNHHQSVAEDVNLHLQDTYLSDFVVPADSLWGGKTLMELDFGKKYGVHVASIIRGAHRINIPGGGNRVFPNDKLQVIGTDEQLSVFSGQLEKVAEGYKDEDFENREMYLKQFVIARNSPFCGRTIRESGVRNKYHCLVVGIEPADDSNLRQPEVSFELQRGDVVWVVGEEKNLNALFEASEVTAKAE